MKKIILWFCVVLALILSACNLATVADYDPFASLDTPTATATGQINFTEVPPSPIPIASPVTVCRVTAPEALNLRAGAGTEYTVTHWLRSGEPLTLSNEHIGVWVKVTTQDGESGWINSTYCK
ncbi:MAG: SH3 domain-containing protein [Chloroflexota bacterium]